MKLAGHLQYSKKNLFFDTRLFKNHAMILLTPVKCFNINGIPMGRLFYPALHIHDEQGKRW